MNDRLKIDIVFLIFVLLLEKERNMGKNLGGGKKKKRGAKYSQDKGKREMVLKADGQEYGMVEKMLGDMRCNVLRSNKTSIICHIRGRFKRRVWINNGDVVLFSLREFEDDKADIIYKYNSDEIEYLKSNGLFDATLILESENPQSFRLDENDQDSSDDENINLSSL